MHLLLSGVKVVVAEFIDLNGYGISLMVQIQIMVSHTFMVLGKPLRYKTLKTHTKGMMQA